MIYFDADSKDRIMAKLNVPLGFDGEIRYDPEKKTGVS
jgi:hypothetical protein